MSDNEIKKAETELNAIISERNGGTLIGCYKVMTEEEKKWEEELNARDMINSCLAYGEGYHFCKDGKLGRQALNYLKHHTEDEMLAIWADQSNDFKARAKVYYGVYTDSEGCTYNSIDWKDDLAS